MKKMIFCDAHAHLSHSQPPAFSEDERYFCVSSCHTREDFDFFMGASRRSFAPLIHSGSGVPLLARARSSASLPTGFATAPYPCAFASYGIHPQAVNPSFMESRFSSELAFLEQLLVSKQIVAIGECGFDFFTPEYKSTAKEQEIVFEAQLVLAQKYSLPLVLHLRKSIEKIFSYSKELKKVPAVIFHSFPGTLCEALSLKNHGINAFFSFGKPILNGKKSAIDCVSHLPIENLLLETDAPYQMLKGESETRPEEIKLVYEAAAALRNIPLSELCEQVERNFFQAFALSFKL